MIIVGIDPGLKGAVCFLDGRTGNIKRIIDIPTMKVGKKTAVDADRFNYLMRPTALPMPSLICIEQVHSRPGQSSVATFSQGRGLGSVEAVCQMIGCPIEYVSPSKWKARMGITGSGKEGAVKKAEKIWPIHSGLFYGPKGGLKHDRAEASLIAKYAADNLVKNIRHKVDA